MAPPVPGRHDGMAAFREGPHDSTLVRNHEVALPAGGNTTAFGNPATAYDPKAPGGTTTVEVDGQGNVHSSYVSINGTLQNCSGRADALGELDHLRGDGQRPRRRS